MVPTRRRYLRGIGGLGGGALTGLAGCVGGAPTNDGRGSTDTRPEGTGGPGITIVSADAEPQSSSQWGFTVLLE